MTYGHMTLEEWEGRGGSLYLEQGGVWYRITDHHVIYGLGRVNYQAEEMTDYEVRQMQAETAKPEPEPDPVPVAVSVVEDPPADYLRPDKPRVPTLQEYAKQRGRRVTHQSTVRQYYRDYPSQKPL